MVIILILYKKNEKSHDCDLLIKILAEFYKIATLSEFTGIFI